MAVIFKIMFVLFGLLGFVRLSSQRYHVSCYTCHDCPDVLPDSKDIHRHSGCITCMKEIYYGTTSRRCVKGHVDTCVAQTSDNLIRRCCNNFDLCNHSARLSGSRFPIFSLVAGLLLNFHIY